MTSRFSARRGVIAVSVAALALAGCSNSETDSDKKVDTATGVAAPSVTSTAAATSSAATEATDAAVTFKDGFVKAKPADKSMTAIFGELVNTTDTPKHIVGFTTSLGEASYEIHEVVDGQMQEKTDGVTVPANGTYTLKPGADHFMIMGYSQPIEAGDAVTLTLKFEDGTTETIKDVPVRTIAAGQEDYGSHGGVEGHSGMSEAPKADHDHKNH
ncbi:copper chaperone PCu(A)C [Corynebacterium aquilae]|uniref:Copper chaperone PCu(A)C n=1 Tax=Corynebacterium aquilae DSM 44791 TaxID=1431546 RepID=A0A1L7CGK3_9CORY|nr:copper chaperone PCu(A)C [Corynebacterium aquilae]APT84883.1 hypothetical protein CAQU_07145 [Corynebacterium aquilae DSM 44791]